MEAFSEKSSMEEWIKEIKIMNRIKYVIVDSLDSLIIT
jgi:hypothetical protein